MTTGLSIIEVEQSLRSGFIIIFVSCICDVGDRRGQEHSGEEVYSNAVRVFDTGPYNCITFMIKHHFRQ